MMERSFVGRKTFPSLEVVEILKRFRSAYSVVPE
jgi:hypothetical protein